MWEEGGLRIPRVLCKNPRKPHSPSKRLRVHTILLPNHHPTHAQGNSEAADGGQAEREGGKERVKRSPGFSPGLLGQW